DYPILANMHARHLLHCRPHKHNADSLKFARRGELANASVTRKELENVKKAAESLLESILELHAPARAILELDPSPQTLSLQHKYGYRQMPLETILRLLVVKADHAEIPELPPTAGKGRRPASRVTDFTIEIGRVYMTITGRLPGIITGPDTRYGAPRGGLFLQFVTDVFEALGLDDKPLAQARAAAKHIKDRKNSMKENPPE
ncbi:MAG TPA: hypothetical protein PLI96_11840, partial [Halothiobacillus sp.]|nr:hypothetical protein [Halothiobacillus sp.]